MSKKYVLLLLLCISCFFLTGCGDVIDLTDEESKLIAEYAAEVLLKYDVNFDDRISSGEKIETEMEEEQEAAEAKGETLQPVTETSEQVSEEQVEQEQTTTEENTGNNAADETSDESSDKEDSHRRDSRITDDGSDADVTEESNDNAGTESDIAKILGMDGISIKYNDYVITDHYPATDTDGQFIYLDASPGYQLLVLKFNISNTTSDTINMTMLDEEVDYRIVCNKRRAANPMLTILMNDLETIEATIAPNDSTEGVLVFQISDDMKSKLENMELKVDYNGTENVINIL